MVGWDGGHGYVHIYPLNRTRTKGKFKAVLGHLVKLDSKR